MDEIFKKSLLRTLKETIKLWGLITITNENILASMIILISCFEMKIKVKKLKGGFAKGEFILGYVNMHILMHK